MNIIKTFTKSAVVLTLMLGSVCSASIIAKEDEAIAQSDEQYYISMDEDGNVIREKVDHDDKGISMYHVVSESGVNIVRFKRIDSPYCIPYFEVGTEIEGYLSPYHVADAAYLGAENGKIKFKVAGVTGLVDDDYVELYPYNSAYCVSYYYVANGKFYHAVSNDLYSSYAASTQRIGNQPSYLKEGVKYYSYDGHYFYTSYAAMVNDYQKNVYTNSVNPNQPYYNYYQYISLRHPCDFTQDQLNEYLEENVYYANSVLVDTGEDFKEVEKYGVNAAIALGISINESGWGTSYLALNKYNLFGLNAVDASPTQSANAYPSIYSCIDDFAKNHVSLGYMSPADWTYYGPHLGDKKSGMNVKYASDPYWGEKAASHGYYIEDLCGIYPSNQQNILIDVGSEMTTIYRSPNTESKQLYWNGNYDFEVIGQFPFVKLATVKNDEGTFYKIKSDGILKSTRSSLATTNKGIYSSYNYAYIKADENIIAVDNMSVRKTPTLTLKESKHTMYRCSYYQIEASCSDENAKVSYQSSNESLATVSSTGKVYAKNNGIVTITVKAAGITKKCVLTIKKHVPVESISFKTETLSLYEGTAVNYFASVSPSNATYKDITYTSSNPYVVKVSSYGRLLTKKPGTAYITATSSNKKTIKLKVVVKKRDLTLNKSNVEMYRCSYYQLFTNCKSSSAQIKWSSSNTSIATIDQNGKLYAKNDGNVTITAQVGSSKATCQFNIKKHVPVSTISLNTTSITLDDDSKYQIKPVISPSNATYPEVTYQSSNTSVASVDQNGVITAKGEGTAYISAISSNKKVAQCKVNVSE